MRYTVVLTWKTANEERVIGDSGLIYCTNIFTSVELVICVWTVTKMLDITFMCPLCPCAGFPLRKPYSLPA